MTVSGTIMLRLLRLNLVRMADHHVMAVVEAMAGDAHKEKAVTMFGDRLFFNFDLQFAEG